jgi:hypothetical protein
MTKKRRRGTSGKRAAAVSAFGQSVPEFLADEKIPPSTWAYWRKNGRAPDVFQPGGKGGRGWITPEAKAAWRARFSGQLGQPPPVEAAE